MPRIVHTFRDYSAESDEEDTPSASSDDNDDDDENEGDANRFDSPAKRFKPNPRANGQNDHTSVLVNMSQNSSTMDDGEVPRILRCIVDGKVKKFKKDSRTWLHKSSAKCKTKPRATSFTCHQSVLYFGPSNMEVECTLQHDKDDGKMELDNEMATGNVQVGEEKKVTHPQTGTSTDVPVQLESSTTHTETEMSCKTSLTSLIPEVGSGISQLADSEAENDCSYVRRLSPLDTDSDTSLGGDMIEWIRRNQFHDECSRTRDDPDVDSDDCTRLVPRRSENGIDISDDAHEGLDREEITHKLAPAIAMEKESFQENLLDYAVNLFGKQLSEQRRLYSKRAHRRCRKTSSAGATSPTGNSARSPTCPLDNQRPGASLGCQLTDYPGGSRQEQLLRLFNQAAYVDESCLEDMDCEENTNSSGNQTCGEHNDCSVLTSSHSSGGTSSAAAHHDEAGRSKTQECPPYEVPALLVTAGRALFTSFAHTIHEPQHD